MNAEFVAKKLNVTTEEFLRGLTAYQHIIEADGLSGTDYVNLIDELPLHNRVKLYLMHKLTAWLMENAVCIPFQKMN